MSCRFILAGESQRVAAGAAIWDAAQWAVVTIRERKRTDEQNRKMWAMLKDVARADPLGFGYDDEDYKVVFMRELRMYEPQFLRGLDGQYFPVGARSSKLTLTQFADLITLIQAWGDQHGVEWKEPKE